ncbi:MAG: hypothetical protein ACJZ87_11320 [Paracoccaceae bacterium]
MKSNTYISRFFLLLTLCFLIGCASGESESFGSANKDKSKDGMFGKKDLKDLKAGIWIDPNGCQHWIIDDGVEGYLSQRLLRNGKPLCLDDFTPNLATGGFKDGEAFIGDLL